MESRRRLPGISWETGNKTAGRGRETRVSGWVFLAAFLAYLALSLLITWPLITETNDHLPGPSNDSLRHYWDGWWTRRALTRDHQLYHTPYLHHPNGISPVSHEAAGFRIVGGLMPEHLVGRVSAYGWVALTEAKDQSARVSVWVTRANMACSPAPSSSKTRSRSCLRPCLALQWSPCAKIQPLAPCMSRSRSWWTPFRPRLA